MRTPASQVNSWLTGRRQMYVPSWPPSRGPAMTEKHDLVVVAQVVVDVVDEADHDRRWRRGRLLRP